jgi:predicted ATPase
MIRRAFSTHVAPSKAYERLVAEGRVRDDKRQRLALVSLDRLWEELSVVPPPVEAETSGGWSSWLGRWRQQSAEAKPDAQQLAAAPRHIYLHGTVGTGKSMLMDLMYANVADPHKQRVHFHDFMLDVHKKIHYWRQHERKSTDDDPIEPVAEKMRQRARLLCFDEFQVTDVADAMILKRLFEAMMRRDMRFVVTSNRLPEELYKGGLNRPLFEPFIANVLRRHFEVVDLSSSNDYRLVGEQSLRAVYLHPLSSPEAQQRFDETFASLTHREQPRSLDLTAFGSRKVHVPVCARGVCLFSWKELIQATHGASDFLAIAKSFHTVMLRDVPKMSVADSEQARRFITCVDALYERRCKLIMLAQVAREQLFPDESEAKGAAQEEVFAFRRTVSRLVEMGSVAYLQQPHRSAD